MLHNKVSFSRNVQTCTAPTKYDHALQILLFCYLHFAKIIHNHFVFVPLSFMLVIMWYPTFSPSLDIVEIPATHLNLSHVQMHFLTCFSFDGELWRNKLLKKAVGLLRSRVKEAETFARSIHQIYIYSPNMLTH